MSNLQAIGVLFLVALVATATAFSVENFAEEEWEEFKVLHGKKYKDDTEDRLRMKIYLENRHIIAKHNIQQHGFTMGMNQFGDMLLHEFTSQFNGYKIELRNESLHASQAGTFITPNHVTIPDSVDWRQEGAVTGVKNQGACGSCWAFSTTGSLEGQTFRKTNKLVSLSEQQLVDCSVSYGNNGCGGGLMDNAFQYVKGNGGIDTEDSYPYKTKQGECRYDPSNNGAECKGFIDIPRGNEDKLKEAVATVGPISIAIDASHESFKNYANGVYNEPDCSATGLDHGVLVVGYGTEDGQDYWLVKNSWGTGWGDSGYIKMSRNKDNQCGVASMASYPLV